MPALPDLPPDLVKALAGTYELLQEIGRGGMGVVYAGRDVRLDRLVAIKVLPDLVSSDAVRERFLREARASARLAHPSIVPIYSADEREGVTFLVMAYVDGTTLSVRLRDGAALSPEDAVPILRDVALALGAAHARGVIHRDIKPENILVDRATGRAMVTDFGIARMVDAMQSGALTRTGQVLGTVGYMSPEQVTGGEVGGRSDLYSLGVVAFETLAGRLPFDGPAPVVIVAHATKPAPPLASVAPLLPAALCAVIDRCLRKDPAERYESGDALAAALEAAVGTRVATTPTQLASGGEDRMLTEREAERVWQRASELQAGIAPDRPLRAPTAAMTVVPRTVSNGFKLEHVRQAAHEAGISAPYVTLALDELLRARADIAPRDGRGMAAPVAAHPRAATDRSETRVAAARAVTTIRTLTPKASLLVGAPMSLLYEAEVAGQLSPNDFDVIAHTIRTVMGDDGIASALGRTLSWSLGGMGHQRRVHISVTATAGRTQIRAEERLGQHAGAIFSASMAAGGAGLGGGSLGVTLGHYHSVVLALGVTCSALLATYITARTIYRGGVHRRAAELEGLVAQLAEQATELIAHEQDDGPR